jgi:hypothetical protein
MFLGHYGVAFALKRAEPKISLGTLFFATQLVDFLWSLFLLFGWEYVRLLPEDNPFLTLQFYDYPITHSLAGALLWGVAAAALYYSWPTRDTNRHWQSSALVGAAVASHWVLDLLVHVRDLPLLGGESPKVGFGLWRDPAVSIALEVAVLGVGVAIYLRGRSRRHPVRVVRLGVVLVVLIGAFAASLVSPEPTSVAQIGVTGAVFFVVMAVLGAWADQSPGFHRQGATVRPAR